MKPKPLARSALGRHPLPPILDGDKETKGRICIVAGSREMPGAALLAAMGAMRAGAGKLTIATVASAAPHVAVAMPEAMVVGLAEGRDGGFAAGAVKKLREAAESADVVVAGPGMMRGKVSATIAAMLLESDARLALDAAVLRAVRPLVAERTTSPLLLPHAGELASLLDCAEDEIERDPLSCGLRAAELYHSNVLVKGIDSHVVTPDGESWRYAGGVPGLGVSGSGDVLAGIAGGLLARGAEPLSALLWAVWLHGEAGARLAKRVGPVGFLAREIANEVPALLAR